jgi:hypothetical protein
LYTVLNAPLPSLFRMSKSFADIINECFLNYTVYYFLRYIFK